MTLTLSEDQLRDVNGGSPVSIQSPEFAGPVVLCRQEEFAEVVLSVVQDVHQRLGDRLSEEQLRDEIKEALFRKAWARAGRKGATGVSPVRSILGVPFSHADFASGVTKPFALATRQWHPAHEPGERSHDNSALMRLHPVAPQPDQS
ncbi:MAG: hypothetical protein WBC44_11020 [Planctomycetaceae bacterium]